jgi:anti-anti-sigma factor
MDSEEPVRIEGEMTIYRAAPLKEQLVGALGSGTSPSPRLDLSRVTEIDTAGLQLILMARRLARARGRALAVDEPSPPVADLLRLCGLEGLIGGAP